MEKISLSDLKPYVRFPHILTARQQTEYKNLVAYDCRFFYTLEGKGTITLGKERFFMEPGTLLIWQPGIEYSFCADENNFLRLFCINFDFSFSENTIKEPVRPSKVQYFNKNNIIEPYIFSELYFLNKPIYQKNRHDLKFELMQIHSEYENKLKYYENKISGIFLSVLTDIIRSIEFPHKNENAEKIIKIIKERYNTELSNQIIADMLGYHPNHVNRLMVRYTGMSLHHYLLDFRINKAMDLLQNTTLSVSGIAEMTGFKDVNHFSKYFKSKIGCTPRNYRTARQ